jgi:hypothetical protein
MPMTAKECRVRTNECIDLARSADALGHAQLLKMADAWLKLAGTDFERESEAPRHRTSGNGSRQLLIGSRSAAARRS